jgi:hypothetical protein
MILPLSKPIQTLSFLFLFFGLLTGCRKKDQDLPGTPPAPPIIPIKVDSSSFTIGNRENNVLDTFVVHYNKPVTINYVLLLSNTCSPNLEWTTVNNGRTVKFYKLLCGRLGEDFKFEISVRDNDGKTKLDSVQFSYYARKLPIEGDIQQYMISPDNKFCWVTTTSNPNRFYITGIENSANDRVYPLSFRPGRFTLNTYNQKLYFLNYPFYTINTDRYYVMNPATGVIEKTVTLQRDQYDDPLKQNNLYDLAFGANGYGVINTGTIETGPSRWRIIDSRYNDTTYAHPEWIAADNGGNTFFREFVTVQPNYNKSKIYLRMQYAFPRAGVLDCATGTLTELVYPSTNPSHYIVPSKTQDKLFIAGYAFQAILQNGGINSYSQYDNRYSETADFSYRAGDQDIIYYRSRDFSYEFLILDYLHAKVLMKTNVRPDFNMINASTDGKYILALSGGGLYLFTTDFFYKNF